jgi:hypothetical protein
MLSALDHRVQAKTTPQVAKKRLQAAHTEQGQWWQQQQQQM